MENKMTTDESLGGSIAPAREIAHGGSNIRVFDQIKEKLDYSDMTNVGKEAVKVISRVTARRRERSLVEIMRSTEGVTQQEKRIRLVLPETDRTNLARVNTGETGHRKERSLSEIIRSTEIYKSDNSLHVNPRQSVSKVVEPRRSNRTIRPTPKVREGLEVSMMNTAQILLQLHDKISQSQHKPIPKDGVESEQESRRKYTSGRNKLSKPDNNGTGKSFSKVMEPRRSNRKMRPTLKLLESWESSMIISEKIAASHYKHRRPKY